MARAGSDVDDASEALFRSAQSQSQSRQKLAMASRLSPVNLGLALIIASLALVFTYSALAVRWGSACGVVTLPESASAYRPAFSPALLGPPTDSFRDNLRNDTQYITSWYSAGWTNDVMTMGNLLYLALLTKRVPILPPFIPSHVAKDAGPIPFSEVFDLPRLSAALGTPIVEWHEVKVPGSPVVDELGGWSVWDTMDGNPRGSDGTQLLNLDISYTKVPEYANIGYQRHAYFWALARLGFPADRRLALGTPRPGPRTAFVADPDEHLLCFDFVYFACAMQPFEYETEYSPAWREVVTHMRWTKRLQNIADEYLHVIFDVPSGGDIPRFISLHARHGDFASYCQDKEPCFPSLAVWDRYVQDIRAELRDKHGIDVTEVVMTSDEVDESWWDEVEDLGWKRVNHALMNTEQRYGKWFPVFIDVVIQGAGAGFVGSEGSTMSLLAQKRVLDWQGGPGRIIPWKET